MIWAIVAFLFFVWTIGVLFRVAGKVIHALLLIAIILLLVKFILFLIDDIGLIFFS